MGKETQQQQVALNLLSEGTEIVGDLTAVNDIRFDGIIKGKIENLLSHLQLTYTRDNVSVSISASAGVVSVPKDGTNFKDLYTAADKALYEAKKTKKGSFKTLDDLKTMQKDKKDC